MTPASSNIGKVQSPAYVRQTQSSNSGSAEANKNKIVDGGVKLTREEIKAHKVALDTLARNYGSLPKDPKTGYASMDTLSPLLTQKGVSSDIKSAVTYFKERPEQYDALETSRERHMEHKTIRQGDGKFSAEDIASERAHVEVPKAGPKASGVDAAGRKELAKAQARGSQVMEAYDVIDNSSKNGVPDAAKIEAHKKELDKKADDARIKFEQQQKDPNLSTKQKKDAGNAYDKIRNSANGADLAFDIVTQATKQALSCASKGRQGVKEFIQHAAEVMARGDKAQKLVDKTTNDPKASEHDKAVALKGLADSLAEQKIVLVADGMLGILGKAGG